MRRQLVVRGLCVLSALSWGAGVTVARAGGDKPTAEEAVKFIEGAEKHLGELAVEAAKADWVKATYITGDTEALSSVANQRLATAAMGYAKQATRFDGLPLAPDVARKLALMKVAIDLPLPKDPAKAKELADTWTHMEGAYGKGKWCRKGEGGKDASAERTVNDGRRGIDSRGAEDECLDIGALARLMATSRNEKELKDAWVGWHAVGAPLRDDYMRYVSLSNEGARELGYKDLGALWRSRYDMPPDAFAQEVDRLWEQVKPLYLSLHAYVRRRLRETYGDVVPAKGPIPAHLLGNMWAQEWGNIFPLVAPKDADPGIDLTARLKAKGVTELDMVRSGERFFTSLGFAPLPASFWERSLFVKPRDREVVCHASAWDVDNKDDLRIKMCIQVSGDDFTTIHHELGHNFYQRAYNGQPYLFLGSAHDGFHEAIGDTLALSITPAYLKQIGLVDSEPDPTKDVGLLLQMALDKLAFLPFGLVVDQWRWKVFSGEITPENANAEWWKLRLKYQGVAPPVARTEAAFDPGAKYHVPANVPYTRYFLAHILQFQFHQALTETAGAKGPLNRRSIAGSKAAGARLEKTLAMGLSRPWPDAMEALTAQRQMDARAISEYFAPLKKWLDEQNKGQTLGW